MFSAIIGTGYQIYTGTLLLILLAIAVTALVSGYFSAQTFLSYSTGKSDSQWKMAMALMGWVIGFVTEYYTSTEHKTRARIGRVVQDWRGYEYHLWIGVGVYVDGHTCLSIGIQYLDKSVFGRDVWRSLSTLGVLYMLCTALYIDAFGPIADNAGGIIV